MEKEIRSKELFFWFFLCLFFGGGVVVVGSTVGGKVHLKHPLLANIIGK